MIPEYKLNDSNERFVTANNGKPTYWDDDSRSNGNILSPYLSIIAFLLSRCHCAAVENVFVEVVEVDDDVETSFSSVATDEAESEVVLIMSATLSVSIFLILILRSAKISVRRVTGTCTVEKASIVG